MLVIDLHEVTGNGAIKNLSGKEKGEQARVYFKVDSLDEEASPVIVKVPEYLYSLQSSYFLGLFSKSVMTSGSLEKFLEHYRFDADATMMKQITHAIGRCLMTRQVPIKAP